MVQAKVPPADSPAERVVAGRYRLIEKIGRGGMAVVWGAVDERLGRPVAIKVLNSQTAARPELRVRFGAEARAAAGLSHPSAVSVYDTGEFAGRPYLVMERLPGGTLRDRIVEGSIDPEWLRTTMVDLLGALAAAHDTGIVHRDVKPGNILITASGTAKLADFGIAKSLNDSGGNNEDLTDTGHLMGTPAYLAPERIDGRPATARSDIYALGVVAYEALAGEKPFKGDGPLAVALAVSRGQHRPLLDVRPDLDAGLVAVIEKAMSANPDDRYPTAEAMREALTGVASAPATQPDADSPTIAMAGPRHPSPESTTQIPAPSHAPPVAPDDDHAPSSGRSNRVIQIVVALLALGTITWLVVYAATQTRAPATPVPNTSTTTPATTAPPPTTTTQAPPTTAPTSPTTAGFFDLNGFLRDLSDSLTSESGGRRAAALSVDLRQVAAVLGTPVEGRIADKAMERVAEWLADGDLSYSAADQAMSLLRQVPGTGPPPTTVIPASALP